jgi:putative hydrolase of HD superfamily
MEKNEIDRFIALQTFFDKMKNIRRKSMVVGRKERENDAEHSWHAAMWFLLLKNAFKDINVERVLMMLLIHDLPEIYCGDVFFFSKDTYDEREEFSAAIQLFLEEIPKPLGAELYYLWNEFNNGLSYEAKVAKAIDYLQPMLQNINCEGTTWKENNVTLADINAHKLSIVTEGGPELVQIYDELLKQAEKLIS